jgi:FkbM family methyltransferase
VRLPANRSFLLDEFAVRRNYLDQLTWLRPAFDARCSGDRVLYVIDAGANVGLFSLFARAELSKFSLTAVGFEPLSDNRALCESNWASNGLTATVRPEALANRHGRTAIHVISTTGATINPDEARRYEESRGRDVPEGEVVELATLDALWPSLGVPRVDLMKLDIEGAEEWALEGAAQVITAHSPAIICSYEHFTNSSDLLKELVMSHGAYDSVDDPEGRLLAFRPRSS